jgi:hypothetical protein
MLQITDPFEAAAIIARYLPIESVLRGGGKSEVCDPVIVFVSIAMVNLASWGLAMDHLPSQTVRLEATAVDADYPIPGAVDRASNTACEHRVAVRRNVIATFPNENTRRWVIF